MVPTIFSSFNQFASVGLITINIAEKTLKPLYFHRNSVTIGRTIQYNLIERSGGNGPKKLQQPEKE